MNKIIYKNQDYIETGTPIPEILYKIEYKSSSHLSYYNCETTGMIPKFYELGFIKENQPINADFLNKYHFELYIDEYLKCKTDMDYIKLAKKIFNNNQEFHKNIYRKPYTKNEWGGDFVE